MSNFTPGPWHDYTDPMSGMIYITDDAGNTIAMTSPMEDDPEAESANARLMAAAPDMLAFIKDIAKRDPVFAKGHHKQHIKDAIALVAKATVQS